MFSEVRKKVIKSSPEIMDRCEIGLHVTLKSGNLKGLGQEQVSKVPHFKPDSRLQLHGSDKEVIGATGSVN